MICNIYLAYWAGVAFASVTLTALVSTDRHACQGSADALCFCIFKSDAVLLFVVGVAFFTFEAFLLVCFKLYSDEAVIKAVISQASSSALVALGDPVYFAVLCGISIFC